MIYQKIGHITNPYLALGVCSNSRLIMKFSLASTTKNGPKPLINCAECRQVILKFYRKKKNAHLTARPSIKSLTSKVKDWEFELIFSNIPSHVILALFLQTVLPWHFSSVSISPKTRPVSSLTIWFGVKSVRSLWHFISTCPILSISSFYQFLRC